MHEQLFKHSLKIKIWFFHYHFSNSKFALFENHFFTGNLNQSHVILPVGNYHITKCRHAFFSPYSLQILESPEPVSRGFWPNVSIASLAGNLPEKSRQYDTSDSVWVYADKGIETPLKFAVISHCLLLFGYILRDSSAKLSRNLHFLSVRLDKFLRR